MQVAIFRIAALSLVLVLAPAGFPKTLAAPRTGVKKPKRTRQDEGKAYSLENIMKSPREYLEREVFFYCRFASTANLFKNVNTRFNSTEHVNFAVWPDKTVLWDENGRRNILPTLYIPKNKPELLKVLREVGKYELVAITGVVLNVYANYPWISVTNIEKAEMPGDRLSESAIEHMQSGLEALNAKYGGVAARHFEQALQTGLPPEYLPQAYEKTAYGYLLDNRLGKARDYLRMAVECNMDDPALNLALADITLKMGDPAEALAHCEFSLEASGRYPQIYGIMGEARSLMGDYAKAYSDLNAAADTPGITPMEKAMVNVRRARIYLRSGRNSDAARIYAAASEPDTPLAGESWLHNEIGLFYEKLYLLGGPVSYLDSAAASYNEAAALARLDVLPLYSLAEVELRRRKASAAKSFDKVREVLERIRQIDAEYVPAKIIEGRALFGEGKTNEAESRYQIVASQIGDNAISLLALAEAYMELNRPDDAVDAIRRARRMEPWNNRVANIGGVLESVAAKAAEAVAKQDTRSGGEPGEADPSGRGQAARSAGRAVGAAYYRRPAAPPMEDGPDSSQGDDYRFASAAGANPNFRPDRDGGRKIIVQPGDRIRVRLDGGVRLEERGGGMQDIQAIVEPARTPGRPVHPVTVVRLPEAIGARSSLRLPASAGNGAGAGAEALDLGYNSGSGNMLDAGKPDLGEPLESQAAIDGPWYAEEPEVWNYETFESDSPISMIKPGEGAYASLSPASKSIPARERDERIPPAFNFDPGVSPLLIADLRAPDSSFVRMPTRNANLFRSKSGGGRQPAEIIEKEPAPVPSVPDLSGMIPPDAAAPRAEVRLPSSSRGVGMASDFAPGA